jgi:hypothetical protein
MIICLAYIAFYFYKKFRLTKKILQYEVNDLRNMSTIPKSEMELEKVVNERDRKKYANLADHSSAI